MPGPLCIVVNRHFAADSDGFLDLPVKTPNCPMYFLKHVGGGELWNNSLRYSKLPKYYLSIQMDVAQDLIYTASS